MASDRAARPMIAGRTVPSILLWLLAGASVVPKTALPDGDTLTVLRDPTGVTFALVEARATS